MKRKRVRSAKGTNWRFLNYKKPIFWFLVVLVLILVGSHPTVKSWFRIISSKAYSWTIVQITNDTGFEWAIDADGSRVLVAKGDELNKPKNLYVYNTNTPQKPPIQVLTNDVVNGDAYLASAKIAGKKVVYTKLRPDKQGTTLWTFNINDDNATGINIRISPEDSSPGSKQWRVRPDIEADVNYKIIYQNFNILSPGPIRRGDLMMVDSIPNAIPVLIAPKVAIVGNHWEYEEPPVTVSPKINNLWIVWRDLIGNDVSSMQTAVYAAKVNDPTNIITLLPPSYFPAVGSFDINNGFAVASVTTKGAGDTTNTNLFYCTLNNCLHTLKLVNTQNTYPYVATQPNMVQGLRVAYMVEKPKSATNPAPVHQQWRYHDMSTGEDNLIAELGSSTNTTVLTERYERALIALMGPLPRIVAGITRRAAPGGIPGFTDANSVAAVGL